jgi:nuclear pore complex protein Nup98-Nup96
VGHRDYGSITWPGDTDVRDLDLDRLVVIEDNSFEVYPAGTKKPPKGVALNRPAEITLRQCWPKDKDSGKRARVTDAKRLDVYERKLHKYAESMGAEFLSYDREAGEWTTSLESF